jgi:hypothetical protein
MLESCSKTILYNLILDIFYLEVILGNLWLFLIHIISIKILYTNNLLIEQIYQIFIGNN